MDKKHQHYSSHSPDSQLKVFTISESLRHHLYIFKTLTGVFSFKKLDLGTKVLIENMIIPKGNGNFLDLGSGYGPIGIVLGYESPGSTIYFIDINKRAIWCCKENISINLPDSKDRLNVFTGNYFEPLIKKELFFNGIFMNPPLRKGREEFLEVCQDVRNYLKPDGFFEFVVKKKMGASFIFKYFEKTFPENKIEILCKRSGYWVFHFTL